MQAPWLDSQALIWSHRLDLRDPRSEAEWPPATGACLRSSVAKCHRAKNYILVARMGLGCLRSDALTRRPVFLHPGSRVFCDLDLLCKCSFSEVKARLAAAASRASYQHRWALHKKHIYLQQAHSSTSISVHCAGACTSLEVGASRKVPLVHPLKRPRSGKFCVQILPHCGCALDLLDKVCDLFMVRLGLESLHHTGTRANAIGSSRDFKSETFAPGFEELDPLPNFISQFLRARTIGQDLIFTLLNPRS